MIRALGKAIGLGFGTGLFPIAPGTVGSLAAVVIYYLVVLAVGAAEQFILAGLIIFSLAVGVWATGLLATEEDPDPGKAVWDEFLGMWITCILLPPTIPWLAAAFICFRVFDVLKPWPARRLENLHGGWGIMADDIAAGIYGFALLNAARFAWQAWA